MADSSNGKSSEEILLGIEGSAPTILKKEGEGNTRDKLDKMLAKTPLSSLSSVIGDNFYGINHRQTPNAIQINKDFYGLTFFTRPRLNLTPENLRVIRQFGSLLNPEPASLQRVIRCLLDPQLAKARTGSQITSPFVDPSQAFIPILTNHLVSMSGWPDVNLLTFTAQEGAYKETFSLVDSISDIYTGYTITANFRNIPGDPITLMFLIWCHYASHVYRGTLAPYPEMIIENEVDYQTRIYRLILDVTKQRVQKIAACGAAFPVSAPIGGTFDFASDRPITEANDQISIPFQCVGAMYQDDILIREFNDTVSLFNPMMNDLNRAAGMVKIPVMALNLFNNRGYPHINEDTYELEWWTTHDEYNERIGLLDQ
jgi:hypothetical protein